MSTRRLLIISCFKKPLVNYVAGTLIYTLHVMFCSVGNKLAVNPTVATPSTEDVSIPQKFSERNGVSATFSS